MAKRKIKLKFATRKLEATEKSEKEIEDNVLEENNPNELEEIISNTKIKPFVVSPFLELSGELETQVANTPTEEKKENSDNPELKPLYETINYSSSSNLGYQESSYQTIGFQNNFVSPSLGSEQRGFFQNPSLGLRPQNPFESPGYPGASNQKYESKVVDESEENKKRRRL